MAKLWQKCGRQMAVCTPVFLVQLEQIILHASFSVKELWDKMTFEQIQTNVRVGEEANRQGTNQDWPSTGPASAGGCARSPAQGGGVVVGPGSGHGPV
jgi:hypothetical protein